MFKSEKFGLALLAIHHPNHFDGKWTLLATFPLEESEKYYKKILLRYGNYPSFSIDWEYALVTSHDGIRLEVANEFLDKLGVGPQLQAK